ncbi:hypothetical protein WT21_29040 [Burkholderia territorii]|uniref:Uncharacterized protein n=1 Tax=Burkholderia territorii TaxID=1503055 RepID=A0A6L3NM78_9BURK|nr:hypothetical protein F7R13_08290 [Burkholderia territorii]KUZ01950.1 hypothetical protein WS47_03865 [Burkholderia territorii]KUZ21107.1 hypothetical protein WS50_09015 [Burkholderia territorii]KVK99515.1 hypothetical protein WS94_21435 [Burkholderia territorii]KVL27594.1 hypothetical protein WS97_28815 [Burkholderia territorii]
MKAGTGTTHIHHSGIRLESSRDNAAPRASNESHVPQWRGALMIALLCALAGCGDGDSGAAGNLAANRASVSSTAAAPVLHCATACH